MAKTKVANAVAFTITADGKAINSMIADFAARFTSITDNAHLILASSVLQAIEHGNADYASRFINVVHGRMDAAGMVKWLCAYGPLKFQAKSETHKHGQFLIDKTRVDELKKLYLENSKAFIAKLDQDKFWEYAPPKAIKDFDLPSLINALIKRGEKVQAGELEVNKKDLRGLEQLKKIAGNLAA